MQQMEKNLRRINFQIKEKLINLNQHNWISTR